MRHLDLFSGIGGFALGASWAGIETVQFVENNNYCQKVLAKNFPGVPIHGDIKTFKGKPGTAEIITGGVPCQPASIAGKRRGTEDDRWLWQDAFRVVREIKPRWCLFENVSGLITLNEGLVFENLLLELEGIGYEVQTFVVPACAVDAPHRRDRVWIVGHAEHARQFTSQKSTSIKKGGDDSKTRKNKAGKFKRSSKQYENVANSECKRLAIRERPKGKRTQPTTSRSFRWPTESGIRRVAHGIPNRVDRIKALGNAIVPQVVYEIMNAINKTEGG